MPVGSIRVAYRRDVRESASRRATEGFGRDNEQVGLVFELVVNFGRNHDKVGAATEAVRRLHTLHVRGVEVPLGEPYVSRFPGPRGYIEFSVWPRGIGYGPSKIPNLDPASLTELELTGIGHDLYSLLRQFDGYRAAIVGWDPEEIVDLHELETEWIKSGDVASLDGLVLATDLKNRWQLDERFVPFAEGYCWLPYGGSKNLR